MTDTQGWWLASDGRWYPPAPPPHIPPGALPPFYPYGGIPSPPQSTSRLAIASLILALCWLGGLGSLLGVILGFVALSQIRRSHGLIGGDGIAKGGIIFGAASFVLTIVVWLPYFLTLHPAHT